MVETPDTNTLLIRLDERVKHLEEMMKNHLQSHLRYSLMAWTVAIGALITLAITLFT